LQRIQRHSKIELKSLDEIEFLNINNTLLAEPFSITFWMGGSKGEERAFRIPVNPFIFSDPWLESSLIFNFSKSDKSSSLFTSHISWFSIFLKKFTKSFKVYIFINSLFPQT
jgi:hypothetical protein